MIDSQNNLDELSDWLTPLISALSDRELKTLSIDVARTMRRLNIARIKSQKGPDGKSYEARKKSKKSHGRVRFIYRDELRDMKSWKNEGDRMTGYDINAGGLRTFIKSKIEKWLPSYTDTTTKTRRKEKMFSKLASTRYLKTHGSPREASVMFLGRVAQIARIHHYGLNDYPARPLLGFSDSDAKTIQDMVIAHLSKK